MDIGKKLEELLLSRDRNVNDLANSIQVSPQTIYSIIKRNNAKVDLDLLQSIADELDASLDYFTGRKSRPVLSREERNLLMKYSFLDARGKVAVHALIDAENSYCRSLTQEIPKDRANEYLQPVAAHADNHSEEELMLLEEDVNSLRLLSEKKDTNEANRNGPHRFNRGE